MESKIAGYKLVPSLGNYNCSGCAFLNNAFIRACKIPIETEECMTFDAIYVPSDTSIEVLKQQPEKQ